MSAASAVHAIRCKQASSVVAYIKHFTGCGAPAPGHSARALPLCTHTELRITCERFNAFLTSEAATDRWATADTFDRGRFSGMLQEMYAAMSSLCL